MINFSYRTNRKVGHCRFNAYTPAIVGSALFLSFNVFPLKLETLKILGIQIRNVYLIEWVTGNPFYFIQKIFTVLKYNIYEWESHPS